MRIRALSAAGALVLLVLGSGLPGAGAVSVPPAAPAPTAGGASPAAPDPHPPAGGIGPDGELVGGPALQSRGLVVPTGAPALPATVTAAAWALVDLDSGDVLAGRDLHGRYQPASILKLLTAVTVLPALPGAQLVTVSAAAARAECACAGLLTGAQYTVDQLMSGLLLVSGNDAAMALAEAYGGLPQTVAAMNAEVLALGGYDTFVQTPSGLDGWQQLTSAYDMALILQAAMNNPRIVAYDQLRTATLPAVRAGGVALDPQTMTNQSNNFLNQVPGALAAKTGFTDAAQHTYVAAAERNGRRLGVVLLRGTRYPVDTSTQATQLLNWGYALPAATVAVGHLDRPVKPAATDPGPTSGDAAAAPAHRSGSGTGLLGWSAVAGLGLAAVLATLELVRRRRQAPTAAGGGAAR